MGNVIEHKPKVTLTDVLRASLACTEGKWAGYTFGSFIAAVRALGVTDDMPLSSIEFGVAQSGNGCITVDIEQGAIEIREDR